MNTKTDCKKATQRIKYPAVCS